MKKRIVSPLSLIEVDYTRYSRQIIYPDFGEEGQIRLKKTHVLIAGVGGLGSPGENISYLWSNPRFNCILTDNGGNKAPLGVRRTPDREKAFCERRNYGIYDDKNRKEEKLSNLQWR
ncbi:MAG: hypothetical protein NTU69_04835 [Proteobacteria bacterium]|nr:hypothetical protein [Pseudomonadota bacterium]